MKAIQVDYVLGTETGTKFFLDQDAATSFCQSLYDKKLKSQNFKLSEIYGPENKLREYHREIKNKIWKLPRYTALKALKETKLKVTINTITNYTMDLIEAKVEAAARSKRQGRKVHIVAVEDGECILSDAPLKGTIHTFVNGSEVKPENPQEVVNEVATKKEIKKSAKAAAEPKAAKVKPEKVTAEKNVTKTKKEKEMKTKVKKTVAKKIAKKSAAPRKAAKKTDGLPEGKKMVMKIKDIVKNLKAGKAVYLASNGRKANLKFNMARPNQDAEREVIYAG